MPVLRRVKPQTPGVMTFRDLKPRTTPPPPAPVVTPRPVESSEPAPVPDSDTPREQ